MGGKRSSAVAFLLVLASHGDAVAQATSYEPIRVDAGLLGGYASGTSAGGFGGMVEPKYLVTDNIGVGVRLEGQVIFGASADRGGDDVGFTSGSVGVVLARAEYKAGTYSVRPVAGVGLGLYSLGGHESTADGVYETSGRYLGVAPQVGLELGRVRLAVTYNAILGAAIEVEQTVGDPGTIESFSQSYYTFELSFHFGGTRLKDQPRPDPVSAR